MWACSQRIRVNRMATFITVLFAAWSRASVQAQAPGHDEIAWTDLAGHRYTASEAAGARATVFLFLSTQCPVCHLYTPRILDMAGRYSPQGVRFFLVDPNVEDSPAMLARYVKERAYPFPVVADTHMALADRLQADTTPEAVVLDATGVVRYRGRIDDSRDPGRVVRHDLRDALDALLKDAPVPQPRTRAFGCVIFRDRPAAATTSASHSGAVTYAQHVAPILNRHCVTCHRAGEVAPFPLDTYRQARLWSAQIKDYTARRLMPPWKAVAGYGDFQNARCLSAPEIATLARWADAGAPPGDLDRLPPSPRFPSSSAWSLGKPDRVLQPTRPYHLAAEGPDVYRNFVLPADFNTECYLSAIDFKPDNRTVVHHMIVFIDPTGELAQRDGHEAEPGFTVQSFDLFKFPSLWAGMWIPGNRPRLLPPDAGIKVSAGARIILQVHYHKSGKPEVDRSGIALYFARGKEQRRVWTWPVGSLRFTLQPGSVAQQVRGGLTLPKDVHVLSVYPHMHQLGREMKVMATLPGGVVRPVVWVKDWDPDWQPVYYLKQPLALPRGTRIEVVATFDNTEQNPRQPSYPPRPVHSGIQTTDEMALAFLSLTIDGETPPQRRNQKVRRPLTTNPQNLGETRRFCEPCVAHASRVHRVAHASRVHGPCGPGRASLHSSQTGRQPGSAPGS